MLCIACWLTLAVGTVRSNRFLICVLIMRVHVLLIRCDRCDADLMLHHMFLW